MNDHDHTLPDAPPPPPPSTEALSLVINTLLAERIERELLPRVIAAFDGLPEEKKHELVSRIITSRAHDIRGELRHSRRDGRLDSSINEMLEAAAKTYLEGASGKAMLAEHGEQIAQAAVKLAASRRY